LYWLSAHRGQDAGRLPDRVLAARPAPCARVAVEQASATRGRYLDPRQLL